MTCRSTAPCRCSVEDLGVEFRTRGGTVRALEGVGFELHRGETLALVGESGSGKSVTAYAMMGILDARGAGHGGADRVRRARPAASAKPDAAEIRGRELAIIFQNPRTALNPIRPVGRQIADILLRHANVTARTAPARAIEMLAKVRIPDPERRAAAYPFELSGGHVPARHDRDGAGLRAGAADRRRADHRARRHDTGGDHGPDRRTRRRKATWRRC